MTLRNLEEVILKNSLIYKTNVKTTILFNSFIEALNKISAKKVLIIDKNVALLYDGLLKEIENVTFSIHIDATENYKTISTYESIIDQLTKKQINAEHTIVAIGGGITSDIAAFAASTYNRGLQLIIVPTTLLCMVDAAIGGKNGVNVQNYKNICGAFYNPIYIIIDINFLKTLPRNVFNSAFAEIIKYGIIKTPKILKLLERNIDILEIIKLSIKTKIYYVERDFHDQGIRKILNFGHTYAHALEKCSHHELSHGEAVAYGMLYEIDSDEIKNYLKVLYKKYNLCEKSLPEYNLKEVILHDKKRFNNQITLVEIIKIGKSKLKTISIEELL